MTLSPPNTASSIPAAMRKRFPRILLIILDASWIVTEETAEFLVLLTLDENLDHVHCARIFYFPFIKSFRTVTREDFFCLQ